MWNSGPFRIVLAIFLAMLVGFLFYNPQTNPLLMKIWIDAYFDGKQPTGNNITTAMSATWLGFLVLSTCINQYVNFKRMGFKRLARMAIELWVMAACLHGPHTLWTSGSVVGYLIDEVYNLLILITITFAVGWNRFDEEIVVIKKHVE